MTVITKQQRDGAKAFNPSNILAWASEQFQKNLKIMFYRFVQLSFDQQKF